MKKYLLTVLKVDDYRLVDDEVSGGSRPRLMLKNVKNYHTFFLKSYTKNPREIWVEAFASILGTKIVAKNPNYIPVQIARIKIIPESLLEKLQVMSSQPSLKPLVAFSDHAFPVGFDIKYGHRVVGKNPRDAVSMSEVYDSISRTYGFAKLHENLLQGYSDMIVFDALIGNMDRHLENWGILENEAFRSNQMILDLKAELLDSVKFTPLFDNGSAGLFELSEEEVHNHLKSLGTFREKYVLGYSYSLITADNGSPTNIFETIRYQIRNSEWKKYLKKSIQAIGTLTLLDMAEVIFKMPEDKIEENENREAIEYSRERKELLLQSLHFRQQILLELL